MNLRKKLQKSIVYFIALSMLMSICMPVTAQGSEAHLSDVKEFDFTSMGSVPVYSSDIGHGFVETSGAIMPPGYERTVTPVNGINISSDGVSVTESDASYLVSDKIENEKGELIDYDGYNFGGLIYRVDTGAPGAYRLEVKVTGSSADTHIAPTGMEAGKLTGTSTWDTAGLVKRETSAKWEGSTWTYDFATGQDFVEIEIEPKTFPTSSAPQTVGAKSIKVTPLTTNEAGDKPTIHILGDSTQKTYTFNECISGWGQTLVDFFDTDKVNVVNYSMGGRSMKANYTEGRADDVFVRGKAGDFVFIHSAHNDESDGKTRFVRGTNYATPAENNTLYNRWLDMYVDVIKARGMTPVLVTGMPRITNGRYYTETAEKPNGFNPDSPGNMRAKAASDPTVGFAELYAGTKVYIDSLDPNEIRAIYNTLEAGETPANGVANGNGGDGTHYKEAASKQFTRIICQSIYDQSVAEIDTYKDKPIMQEIVSYMKGDVQNAAATRDWSAVLPEMAPDVSALGVIPGAGKQPESNYYYRPSIEKVLQLGIMQKDTSGMFYPNNEITVGEFARSIEKAFDLPVNSLTSYTKTSSELWGDDDKEPKIKSVDTSDRVNTTVTLENITSGIVIGVRYDGGMNGSEFGELIHSVKMTEVSSDTVILEGITADKVFVWNSIDSMEPICEPWVASGGGASISAAEASKMAEPENNVQLADGEVTVTVNQPTEGGTVTIYNESSFNTATTDIKTSGISANTQFADTDYYTLIAPETVVTGTDKGGVFTQNTAITTAFLETNSSGKQMEYNSKADGTLTLYLRCRADRPITLETVGGGKEQLYIDGGVLPGADSTNYFNGISFDVKAGTTYKIYGQGTTARLFGLKYASEYENSTESLIVGSGDSVRVAAKADAYWLNDTITVNGDTVSNEKEYTFTITSNTTVSATFVENPEPKLVETTVIASDAALTREAMGAILYDAYLLKYGKNDDGSWVTLPYMKAGSIPSPGDPDYDPNMVYSGETYFPLTGWAALTDTDDFDYSLYAKTKEAYNLGLMRSETGIMRGAIANGKQVEPKVVVTRAKAAKTLAFAYNLTQPTNGESQVLPNGNLAAITADITIPNPNAPSTPWFEDKEE